MIRKKFQLNPVLLCLFFLGVMFNSCTKDNFFELNTPSWLGSSIYEQLQVGYTDIDGKNHTFKNYVRLIDDIGYSEVLKTTGSKTLFVTDDDAFNRFFESNSWNVHSFEQLTIAQKKLILNSSMINNALLIENLSTIEGGVKGQGMRRATALSVSDTIPFEQGSDLPASSYWDRFRSTGIHLAKDNTPTPMLLFLQAQMDAQHFTDDDFSLIFNGKIRENKDAYVYSNKVKVRDITCQNGYIHIMEDVLVPPSNMAEVMRKAPEIKIFSSFIERFSAPYASNDLTNQFHLLGGSDSVYVKGYFSEVSSIVPFYQNTLTNEKFCLDPNKTKVNGFLMYDPGMNYYAQNNYQTDMGVIFAPSDDALNKYFTEGAGRALIDRYGRKEDIPNDVLDKLINNHMKPSFLASLPSKFPYVLDDAQEKMGVTSSQIDKVYLASNGVVYVTNTVYPPALYSSVMYPAYVNENMKVFRAAIKGLNFDSYLLSMVNTYSFLIPTDNFTYVVPTSLKYDKPEVWVFHYDETKIFPLYATVYTYDPNPLKPYHDRIGTEPIRLETSQVVLLNHLEDMLDYHIIVGKIEGDKEYYRTKGGGTIRITKTGNGDLYMAGGGDIERNDPQIVKKVYDQSKETNQRGNGKVYVMDEPVQTPTRSVYSVLSDHTNYPQFSEFFKLLQGADDLWTGDDDRTRKYTIFYTDASQAGLDFNVRFLNTYHYTLYVPTNDQVLDAINNGLPTWEDVAAETDQILRDTKANQIIRFLRYHFQDNSVYVDNIPVSGSYQTATLNLGTQTFYTLKLNGGNNLLSITDGNAVANVVKTDGLYNIMARDFKFDTADPKKARKIETSSYTVIHQIDKCLYFEGEKELLSKNKLSQVRRKNVKH